jgi:hypothetical protein
VIFNDGPAWQKGGLDLAASSRECRSDRRAIAKFPGSFLSKVVHFGAF